MMNSFSTKSFKKLKSEWYSKLKENGFNDLEDSKGNLTKKETRTIAWKNREMIRDFYLNVGKYLNSEADISSRDRLILYLWTNGRYQSDISNILGVSHHIIQKVVRKHTKIVLNSVFNTPVEDNNES